MKQNFSSLFFLPFSFSSINVLHVLFGTCVQKNPFIIIMDRVDESVIKHTYAESNNNVILAATICSVHETLHPNIHTSPFHEKLRRTF